jgi:site-specific DNA-methyltransferase (adenine-specific)
MIDLRLGNCLEVMKTIPDNSVDAIITDPPYGTTSCKWDSVIDLKLMWEQLNRIIKPNGAIVLFAQQPFTSVLVHSNIKLYRHKWIWKKGRCANFMVAKAQPLKYTEDILVFCNYGFLQNQFKNIVGTYNPQMRKSTYKNDIDVGKIKDKSENLLKINERKNPTKLIKKNNSSKQLHPNDIISFNAPMGKNNRFHPTQKPVELMEYLIKTYTNEGETVLDFTMGSGTTGVAAKNLNRNFIGIEMDDAYFSIAENRINKSDLFSLNK